ncbi:MAG: hypothetical protein R2735_12090 [Microthrixaceae bacterium]
MHFDVADREPVELTGPHAIAEFHKSAMARFGFYVFTALATHVDLGDGSDPSAATGRVWMCEIRRSYPAWNGQPPTVSTRTATNTTGTGGPSPSAGTRRSPAPPDL